MINSSELFMNGELNLVEAKQRIFENIISQRPGNFHGTLRGILFGLGIHLYGEKSVFYIPEYKLKVSFLDKDEWNLDEVEVEVIEVPHKEWEIVPIDTPLYGDSSRATFHILRGALHLCFFRSFQTLKKDLSIEIGEDCKTAIKIDIVNRTFECINYEGETAPVDLLDAYQKMRNYGYFFTNVGDIHEEVFLEREKNEAFDKACEACWIYDMLDKRHVQDTLFLLNAYMINPTAVTCLYDHDYGYTVLTGFAQACHFDSLSEPGEVMAAFSQLFGKGDTVEEILGATSEELSHLHNCKSRTRDKTSLSWVRFIQKKKGLPIHQRSF